MTDDDYQSRQSWQHPRGFILLTVTPGSQCTMSLRVCVLVCPGVRRRGREGVPRSISSVALAGSYGRMMGCPFPESSLVLHWSACWHSDNTGIGGRLLCHFLHILGGRPLTRGQTTGSCWPRTGRRRTRGHGVTWLTTLLQYCLLGWSAHGGVWWATGLR